MTACISCLVSPYPLAKIGSIDKFHTEALSELLESDQKFGFIVSSPFSHQKFMGLKGCIDYVNNPQL